MVLRGIGLAALAVATAVGPAEQTTALGVSARVVRSALVDAREATVRLHDPDTTATARITRAVTADGVRVSVDF